MVFVSSYSTAGTNNFSVHFHPDHLADLRASGLSDKTIRAAGVYSLAPRDIARFFSQRKGVPTKVTSALCFPYQGGDFARIKLFPPLDKMKYSQPPNTSARLYVPFPVNDGAIWVAEGEKKCLAAHQAGLNAVGIGGVWNWISNGNPIDDLTLIDWQGRDAVLVPDSDVFERPDLLRAIYALGRELRALGASVLVAQILQPGPEKVGLDDYLLAGGRIEELELLGLDQKTFRGAQYWHEQWKLRSALRAA